MISPLLFKKIKELGFHEYEVQYTCEKDGISYRGLQEESKYFYRDIHSVILDGEFAILQCGKQLIYIDKQDYYMIESYLKSSTENMLSQYDRTILRMQMFFLIIIIQLFCLEIGYTVILKRLGFEYFFNAMEATLIVIIIICIVILSLMRRIQWKKSIIGITVLSSLVVIVGTFIVFNYLSIDKTIYSLSSDMSSQLVLKQNKEDGKIKDYHYTFLFFGKKYNEMSGLKDSEIDTRWITGDCNIVTYRDADSKQEVYVATYGERGDGISYYNVVGSMSGDWQTYNSGDKDYQLRVENNSITVKTEEQETIFSPQEVEQNGTIAITLMKGNKFQYVIALNKDVVLNKNHFIKNDGHITIVPMTGNKTAVELFCTTYKEDQEVQDKIDDQMREQATELIKKCKILSKMILN